MSFMPVVKPGSPDMTRTSLGNRPILQYTVQYTVYSVQCTVCSLHSRVNSVQCTVYSFLWTVYSVQCAVSILWCIMYNVKCAVYSVQYTVYSVQCTVYSVQWNKLSLQTCLKQQTARGQKQQDLDNLSNPWIKEGIFETIVYLSQVLCLLY